jgi:hypothetical protein
MRTGSGAKIWPVSRDKKALAGVPLMERCNPKSIKGILARYRRTLLWYHKAAISYDIGLGEEIKAFARLDRGTRYPFVSAMSGMSGYSQGYRVDVLNNEIWTGKAQDLCRVIRFDVSRGSASYVEKQFIAFYMDRH